MNKREVKRQINLLYNETIHHGGLPPEYKEGMKNFKSRIFDYIISIGYAQSAIKKLKNNGQ